MLKKTELMGPGLSKATNFLGPLGVFSNTMSTLGSVDDIYHHGANAENVVGLAGNSTGLVSSGISTAQLMLGASETLEPIGAVLGMFAGSVAAGQGANNVAAENNYFGDNRSVSNWSADIADGIRESGHPILGGLSIPFTSLGGNAYTGARWAGGKIAYGAGAVKDGASWSGGQAVDAGAAAWHAGGRAVDYAKDNMTLDPDEIDWGRTFNPFDW